MTDLISLFINNFTDRNPYFKSVIKIDGNSLALIGVKDYEGRNAKMMLRLKTIKHNGIAFVQVEAQQENDTDITPCIWLTEEEIKKADISHILYNDLFLPVAHAYHYPTFILHTGNTPKNINEVNHLQDLLFTFPQHGFYSSYEVKKHYPTAKYPLRDIFDFHELTFDSDKPQYIVLKEAKETYRFALMNGNHPIKDAVIVIDKEKAKKAPTYNNEENILYYQLVKKWLDNLLAGYQDKTRKLSHVNRLETFLDSPTFEEQRPYNGELAGNFVSDNSFSLTFAENWAMRLVGDVVITLHGLIQSFEDREEVALYQTVKVKLSDGDAVEKVSKVLDKRFNVNDIYLDFIIYSEILAAKNLFENITRVKPIYNKLLKAKASLEKDYRNLLGLSKDDDVYSENTLQRLMEIKREDLLEGCFPSVFEFVLQVNNKRRPRQDNHSANTLSVYCKYKSDTLNGGWRNDGYLLNHFDNEFNVIPLTDFLQASKENLVLNRKVIEDLNPAVDRYVYELRGKNTEMPSVVISTADKQPLLTLTYLQSTYDKDLREVTSFTVKCEKQDKENKDRAITTIETFQRNPEQSITEQFYDIVKYSYQFHFIAIDEIQKAIAENRVVVKY